MKAVDTNILVRWFTRDDEQQTRLADAALSKPSFVSLTVLLETSWVLGSRTYRYTPAMVSAAVETLLGLGTAAIEAEEGIRWALERHRLGADLADMLHLIAARATAGFVTFDRELAIEAGSAAPIPIETLG